MAEAVVSRLLTAAVADTAVSVRRQVLRAFERTTALDAYLAQADRCAWERACTRADSDHTDTFKTSRYV